MSDAIESVAALDLGSHSFKLVVAEEDDRGKMHPVLLKTAPAMGMSRGAIVNMEQCVTALTELFISAEEETGRPVESVKIGYTGENVTGVNSMGVAAIGRRGHAREVTDEDKGNVIAAAQAIVVPGGYEIAHIVPLSYTVDGMRMTSDPVNILGVRLEAEAHIIVTSSSALESVDLAIRRAGRRMRSLIYSPLASAGATLTKEEKARGVILIDLGFATTKISFYKEGEPYYNTVLPIGAGSLTGDLAMVLGIPRNLAESVKIEHGCCYMPLLEHDAVVYIPGTADRPSQSVGERHICDVISARMADIYNVIYRDLAKKGWMAHAQSAVITGGGANLPGVSELAQKIFKIPARGAYILGFDARDEESGSCLYGTVMGLIKAPASYSWERISEPGSSGRSVSSRAAMPKKFVSAESGSGKSGIFFEWLRDFF